MSFTRETVKIPSVEDSVNLDVWLYKPEGPGPYPVVVAGHGLTLVKEAGFAVFGELWAKEAGYASLILDYRGFGDSEGLPRNFASLEKQYQDFTSVIEWARDRSKTFNRNKIVVMGGAIAGIVVSKLLVDDASLAGGMAHCPVLDGRATLQAGSVKPKLIALAMVDYVRGLLGWGPIFVPAVGKPGEFAMMDTPSAQPGFEMMYKNCSRSFSEAPNQVAPRLAFEMMSSRWRSGLRLSEVKSRLLIIAPISDDMIPFKLTERLVRTSGGKAELTTCNGGHFDVMEGGQGFEANIHAQISFLRSVL